jgi:N-acetyl-D-muramate 6-phosphate phosphatase
MTLDLMRVQAICFDNDGTLSDTDDQWVALFEQRLSLFRRAFPQGDVRRFARWAVMSIETPGNLLYHILDRFDLDESVGRVYNFVAQKRFGYRKNTFWIIAGVREALFALNQKYPMALVSARDRQSVDLFLLQYGLQALFPVIATAMTCRHTKPYPDPVLWAAAQMAVAPENCLMVGDTPVDIRAGKLAGAQTVGVLSGFGQEKELRQAGADLIVADVAALAGLLIHSHVGGAA